MILGPIKFVLSGKPSPCFDAMLKQEEIAMVFASFRLDYSHCFQSLNSGAIESVHELRD